MENQDPNYGKRVEVGIHFNTTAMTQEQKECLMHAREFLNKAGITFDTGRDSQEMDWEWDWSLHGPVRITFRRFIETEVYNNPKQIKLDLYGEYTSETEQ